jgi:tetratricopeptide (TPR) repeat protein
MRSATLALLASVLPATAGASGDDVRRAPAGADAGVLDTAGLRARLQLALQLRGTGRRAEARVLLERFYDDWDRGAIDRKDASALVQVALAAQALGRFQDANDTFRDAVRADPKLVEAHVGWGNLFLEKYAVGEAERCFSDALAIDSGNADANAGMARVKVEQDYDVAAADGYIDRALRRNPAHAGALLLRAEIALDLDDFESAGRALDTLLAVNPKDAGALSLRGAAAVLQGDRAEFSARRAAVLAVDPASSLPDRAAAEVLEKRHRYDEAMALLRGALALDPDDATARASLATNLLRTGDEKRGLVELRAAWERDRFNVRTYNLLQLFEEVIPRDYALARSPHFRIRLPRERLAALRGPVADLLERAYRTYAKGYAFRPSGPIVVELYQKPEHYAVRAIGLPGLGALGICFGRVLTSIAPNGKFNWAQVLWHETAHVFSLGLSRSRVPRWLTEGLADHEASSARPEWRRHGAALFLASALREGRLPPLHHMDRAFLQARSLAEIVVAYYAAEQAVDFLIRRFGQESLVRALRRMGDGIAPEAALREMTGLDGEALDAAFRADLSARLALYDAGSAERFKARVSEAHEASDRDHAAELLRQAAQVDPDSPAPWEPLARFFAAAGRQGDALEATRRWAELDGTNLAAQKAAFHALLAAGRRDDAARFARTALDIDPEDREARAALRYPEP